jgi:hypothetical protein
MARSVLNPRQEKFADLFAAGSTAKDAYLKSFPRCKSADAAEVEGSRLLKNPKVAAAIAKRRMQSAEDCRMTKQELLDYLVNVIRSRPDEATMANALCELAMTKMGPVPLFPSKLGCIQQLARMCGWNEPDKLQHEAGDTLANFLLSLRAGKS